MRVLSLLLLLIVNTCGAWRNTVLAPFRQIQNDYLALTRRVTARHILLPSGSEDVCLALKQKIRESSRRPTASENSTSTTFVTDSFARAATKYSADETTNDRGGLLGELVPQGYCQSEELDRACFQVRLGVVEGPIETKFGVHLLLVTERLNCPKLDGRNTKLVQLINGTAALVPSEQPRQQDTMQLALSQVVFWITCLIAGGFVAELAASL